MTMSPICNSWGLKSVLHHTKSGILLRWSSFKVGYMDGPWIMVTLPLLWIYAAAMTMAFQPKLLGRKLIVVGNCEEVRAAVAAFKLIGEDVVLGM